MLAHYMTIRTPSEKDIEDLSEEFFLNLNKKELGQYKQLVQDTLESYDAINKLGTKPDQKLPRIKKREPGHRVGQSSDDDRYNAWITRCNVEGEESGPLSGWEIGIKDNIAVGNVEMTCGSKVLEGYVPSQDATVVKSLLRAGATVTGKTNMDDMAFTGNGHSSAFGPTLNPHDDNRLAGGSSGGSAIAVQQGEVDAALGADQGGSIRIPAAWTGVVGHKPTHGLVPYTGAVGIENTIDHCGPLAADVETAAEVLSVIAGKDPSDPRQPKHVPTEQYENKLHPDLSELSVGVIEEGFNRQGAAAEVNESVNHNLDLLEDKGATIESVSVPLHADAMDIYTVALGEGFVASIKGEGEGHNWKGEYNTEWINSFGNARRARGSYFPPSVKLTLLVGGYARDETQGEYYARAMNLRNRLTEQYDSVLKEFDVVAMPTTPMQPNQYKPDADVFEFIADAWGNLANTSAFNMTGHPSISVPIRQAGSLPVGLMLTGTHFDDATVLRAGQAAYTLN
jgi:amidase